MKIETAQKFFYRVKLLNCMKDDYLSFRGIALDSEHCDECIHLLDVLIKAYMRKLHGGRPDVN